MKGNLVFVANQEKEKGRERREKEEYRSNISALVSSTHRLKGLVNWSIRLRIHDVQLVRGLRSAIDSLSCIHYKEGVSVYQFTGGF